MQRDTKPATSWAQLAEDYVDDRIGQLQHMGNEALTRASLARLRRGIGKPPGALPELWGLTLDGMPEVLVGKGEQPSRGEWACYVALTMFALHQQSRNPGKEPMSKRGNHLGKAVRSLAHNNEELERVKRRFDQVITADSPQEIAHHLRSLVQLLRAQGIALDYPALTRDLYRFQNPDHRDSVRLKWGRQFYSISSRADQAGQTADGQVEDNKEENHEEQ